ncbi:serine-rich adhesin for platelets-like [Plodia interpunctella]|uniref:serine-rich adhesin for platelets-like n=1 Tax=Plodia interpunctella TaxID=58824 RepID=UPI002368D208|nr:serine-rich adhesin for platelets-like [Plodia interpunctella]
MNLVIIAAVIAVAGAAKLDRTYLPPASAKTAGGNPGELQTPFSSFNQELSGTYNANSAKGVEQATFSSFNQGLGGTPKTSASAKTSDQTSFSSFNQGLGGIPKGGFENDFKGVVVDAASPGTRASGHGETGLGAPRIAYGSTNSKVGDAAFRGSDAGFRQQFGNGQNQATTQNQIPDGQTAGTTFNAQSFAQNPGQFVSNYQRSQGLITRDQNANTVRFDSNVGTDSFSYSFETDNGISADESGVATNGVQAQGGFSYTGDDGQVYSVTYTADEGGYQPKGDHLPTPPPIPEEILKSLEQNAREEAAGLVDDGSYDAQKYNEGGDYTDDGATHNGRQPAFVNRPESDVTASGTFINQNNQPFVRPDGNGQAEQSEHTNTANTGSSHSNFGSSHNKFAQAAASSNSPTGFGQANQVIPNRFQQNRPTGNTEPKDSENANTFVSPTFETNSQTGISQNFIQGQSKPQQASFGKPQATSQTFNGETTTGSINTNNAFGQSSNNGFGQRHPTSSNGNTFGNNEYLPPVNGNNRRPSQSTPQKPNSLEATQGFNQFAQTSSTSQATSPPVFPSGTQTNIDTTRPQFGASQGNQFASNQKPAGSVTSQNFGNLQSNGKPSFGGSQTSPTPSHSSGSFPSFQPLQSTAQPSTELTTPFENTPLSQQGNNQQSVFGSFNTQSSQNRPIQSPFGAQPNKNDVSQFTSTSASSFTSATSSSVQGFNSRPQSNIQPSSFTNQRPQGSSQSNQQNNFAQSQSQNMLTENQSNDAQFAPSTQRPIFSQNTQAQGPDDSYYYNQPSKSFNTPNTQAQVSRFPNTPFNQFNRVTQRPTFSSQSNGQGSTAQNNQPQGSNRYPRPPTLSSVAPTSPTLGSTTAYFNGITQASASAFTGAPTPSSQFGSQSAFPTFGRKPAQQTSGQFSQASAQTASSQSSFDKQPTAPPQSFSNINRNQFKQQNSFQQTTNNANQQPANTDDSPAVTSQQYNGEIYEYTKPAQTLPPPTEEDKKAGFGQFGRQPTKPTLSQQQTTQEPSDSQSGSTQNRPQLPAQQNFGQKIQTSQQFQSNIQTNRPQFGQQTTPSGNINPTQASSFTQSQSNQFTAQASVNVNSQSAQQFGSRPFKSQPTHSNEQSIQQSGSQGENRPICCKPFVHDIQPTQSNQFSSQNQFGVSDFTAQGFKADQPSAQSVAGKGEVFGGPRKPPSFDETGYHY